MVWIAWTARTPNLGSPDFDDFLVSSIFFRFRMNVINGVPCIVTGRFAHNGPPKVRLGYGSLS